MIATAEVPLAYEIRVNGATQEVGIPPALLGVAERALFTEVMYASGESLDVEGPDSRLAIVSDAHSAVQGARVLNERGAQPPLQFVLRGPDAETVANALHAGGQRTGSFGLDARTMSAVEFAEYSKTVQAGPARDTVAGYN